MPPQLRDTRRLTSREPAVCRLPRVADSDFRAGIGA
jgi:hypothetical protein